MRPKKRCLNENNIGNAIQGKEGRMVAAFPDKVRCMELLTKLLGWAEPTQMNISVEM